MDNFEKNNSTRGKMTRKDLITNMLVVAVLILIAIFTYYSRKDVNPSQEQNVNTDTQIISSGNPEDVVAKINDTNITRKELDEMVNTQISQDTSQEEIAQIQTQAIDFMVNQEILYQYASAQISTTDEQIQSELENIKKQFENEEAFQSKLSEIKMSEETLLTNIKKEIIFQQFTADYNSKNPVAVTQEEIQNRYDSVASLSEDIPPLEEVTDEIKIQLEQEKQSELLIKFIDSIKINYKIEILL